MPMIDAKTFQRYANDPEAFRADLVVDANGTAKRFGDVQDAETLDVLMVGYMNAEAVEQTLKTGRATYWSRSRQKFWIKGETSGHYQNVREIRFDCDRDTLLLLVDQEGAACSAGYRSCFYRKVDADGAEAVILERVVDPDEVYGPGSRH